MIFRKDILHATETALVLDIASMQEMVMKDINFYFDRMHKIAQKTLFHFFCCNRESKILLHKRLIAFSTHPWKELDEHYFDELFPRHQDYYRITPKFYFAYNVPIICQFSKLSA